MGCSDFVFLMYITGKKVQEPATKKTKINIYKKKKKKGMKTAKRVGGKQKVDGFDILF